MKHNASTSSLHSRGMTTTEILVLICVIICLGCLLFIGARFWKRGSDRAANIMNLRNCQQAMRGHQGMNQLNFGDPFTKADLNTYMRFPIDVNEEVRYTPGTKVMPMGKLWLQVTPPGDVEGEYGPEFHQIRDW